MIHEYVNFGKGDWRFTSCVQGGMVEAACGEQRHVDDCDFTAKQPDDICSACLRVVGVPSQSLIPKEETEE